MRFVKNFDSLCNSCTEGDPVHAPGRPPNEHQKLPDAQFLGIINKEIMPTIPSFSLKHLQEICDVLGDASIGLPGAQIGTLLARCQIPDPEPGIIKRRRLYQALNQQQEKDACANSVIAFIQMALEPTHFITRQRQYEDLLDSLNDILNEIGYQVGDDGLFRTFSMIKVSPQVQRRVNRVRIALEQREVHPDIMRCCRPELIRDSYLPMILEAARSAAQKLRQKTGLSLYGANLADESLSLEESPLLVFNSMQSGTELGEHIVLMQLIRYMLVLFDGPPNEPPPVNWQAKEQDALDILVLLSMLHRHLDQAVNTRVPEP